jgi:NAD(P)H-quinone oxidoreductase subunit 5
LRLAPLVAEVTAAQVLLVVVGTCTAVLAALVMATRISIKVQLAWSTCAQMGFMLMQCGLGAWEMALLHLLAHSLYKAHAFLAAGGAVRRASVRQLSPAAVPPSAMGMVVGGLAGVWMTVAAGLAWTVAAALWHGQGLSLGVLSAAAPTVAIWVLAGIVALALVPLLHPGAWRTHPAGVLRLLATAFGVALGYVALHALFAGHVVPAKAGLSDAPVWLALAVALAFAGLFAGQVLISAMPGSHWARRLYPWFYGGLFLDEAFTRIAFALWPPRPTAPSDTTLPFSGTLRPLARPAPGSAAGPVAGSAA